MKLLDYLTRSKISFAEFSRSVCVSPNAVGHWVNGRRVPRAEILERIKSATKGKVTANDFFHGGAK